MLRNSRMNTRKPQRFTLTKSGFKLRSALFTILPETRRHTFD